MADWQWQLEINEDDKRKATLVALATGGAAAACIALAVVTAERFWIVLAFMLASIFVLGRTATSRLRTLRASVDGPILTLQDKRETTAIDLRTVDQLEVRQRASRSASRRWVIEASGDGVVALHQLPDLELYLTLAEETIAPLRAGIEHYHQWYRSQGQSPASPAAATATKVMAPLTPSTADGLVGTSGAPAEAALGRRPQDDFEWRPPLHPNADRNRRRVLIVTLLIAAAIAAIAVQQSWGDPTGILLSIAVVPSLVLLLGLGCWYAYTPAQKFRLTTSAGELQAWKGDKQVRALSLAGVTDIVVDVSHNRNHQTNTTSSHPYVRVVSTTSSEQMALPVSLGMNLTAEERVRLERELKRQAGLV